MAYNGINMFIAAEKFEDFNSIKNAINKAETAYNSIEADKKSCKIEADSNGFKITFEATVK